MSFGCTQVDALREAAAASQRNGAELRLLDITAAMELRPDGHPSRYGHWASENVTLYNDCEHWRSYTGAIVGHGPPLSLKFF